MPRENRRATMYYGRKVDKPILEKSVNCLDENYQIHENPRRFKDHPMVLTNPLGIIFGYVVAQSFEGRN